MGKDDASASRTWGKQVCYWCQGVWLKGAGVKYLSPHTMSLRKIMPVESGDNQNLDIINPDGEVWEDPLAYGVISGSYSPNLERYNGRQDCRIRVRVCWLTQVSQIRPTRRFHITWYWNGLLSRLFTTCEFVKKLSWSCLYQLLQHLNPRALPRLWPWIREVEI